jgi:hypothetical protein
MVKPNALTSPMKTPSSVAIKDSPTMTTRSADVSKSLNSLVPLDTVFLTLASVMVKNNVLMDLMMVTRNVASKVTTSTTSRDVVATQKLSSPAPTENALKTVNTVMEKLNAPMDLMIAPNNAASEDTASTTLRFAVAIQRVSGDVLTVTASKKTIFVMVK